MPKAAKKLPQTETTCPALAMAKLIGLHCELEEKYGSLAADNRRLNFAAQAAVYDQGQEAASWTAETALIALAVAPTTSREGAIAKIVASLFMLEQELDCDVEDAYRRNEARFRSKLFIQDAMNFFARTDGITPEAVGMGSYYNRNLEPQARLAAAGAA
jgi:hypothetical protein